MRGWHKVRRGGDKHPQMLPERRHGNGDGGSNRRWTQMDADTRDHTSRRSALSAFICAHLRFPLSLTQGAQPAPFRVNLWFEVVERTQN